MSHQFSDESLRRLGSTASNGIVMQGLAAELLEQRAENARLTAELAKANKLEENLLATGETLAKQAE